ncbi:response regulator [Cohnella hongkongensis]|uniref:Response regulator n=1 Tax=Cohnella hongkongensis TaxID=178337 RepID=A0ABV9F6H6_9BACL
MKVLIVDDEKNVRDAIKLLIPWQDYEVAEVMEAQDIETAKACVGAHKPEIVFLDMMLYNQSGIEVLKWANEQSPHSKIIVVSGYNDFEYVQNTVRYGGLDYLLKPIDRRQLLDAFEKAIKEWRHEELSRTEKRSDRMRMNQIQPIYWDKTFSDFIETPSRNAELLKELDETLHMADKPVQIALLSLKLIHGSVYERFSSHLDLLYFSFTNICNEYLNASGSGYAFRNWNAELEIGIILWCDSDRTKRLLEEINEGIETTFGAKLFISVGGAYAFPHGAAVSYQEARTRLLHHINLKQAGQWIFEDPGRHVENARGIYLNEYEEKLVYAIRSGQLNVVQTAVRNVVNEMRKLPEVTLNLIQIWFYELQIICSKHFKEYQDEADIDFKRLAYVTADVDGRVRVDEWLDELERSFVALGRTIADAKKEKESVASQIADYIQRYYHEDVSLQQIAERFYLSREYISRKFKQDIGENLFDYLMKVRLDKACSLLRETDLNVQEISRMVGIDNEKHFSKVFKKYSGLSPSQYRTTPIEQTEVRRPQK